jgi:hypothetical protein
MFTVNKLILNFGIERFNISLKLFQFVILIFHFLKLLMITELQNLMVLRSDVADDEIEFKN